MSRLERLRAIYNQLPKIECKGLCWDSCGPVSGSTTELERVRRVSGRELTIEPHPLAAGTRMCCHLTPDGRCAVYAQRPFICRLWGVVEGMPCHHGCRPAHGLLPDRIGMALLARTLRVGGDPEGFPASVIAELEQEILDGRYELRGINVPGLSALAFGTRGAMARALSTSPQPPSSDS
jgi:Fe-S-cluster containining protein